MSCQKVIYSGNVQGVGFRYRTVRLARGFSVAGYVKNLPDGSVEVLAEGENDQVDQFLAAIADEMSWHIRASIQSTVAPQGYTEFSVVH